MPKYVGKRASELPPKTRVAPFASDESVVHGVADELSRGVHDESYWDWETADQCGDDWCVVKEDDLAPPDFGKNQMPAEMASELLKQETVYGTKAALCQCIKCLRRYLSQNRLDDGSFINNLCELCTTNGIPLAPIRGTLTDALSLECLALIGEEAGEIVQREGKIIRWGWEATFEGTTQQHKLETELGDIIAAMVIADFNHQIDFNFVISAANEKLRKFREDAAGPRQRLLVAEVPDYDLDWELDDK